MTSYVFQPNGLIAPSFYATLDGGQYNCVITWNVSAKRYYINCYAPEGGLVFAVPVVSTLTGIQLVSLNWDVAQEVVTGVINGSFRSIGLQTGMIADMTIENCIPVSFNLAQEILVINDTTFTYLQSSDPGPLQTPGAITAYISLTAGYFNSTMIFRNGSFEVNP